MSNFRWWTEWSPTINGVFKGGGAKGLLYAGAIEAVAEHERWFRAVAGSSAGAITATLIAAGLTPQELKDAARDGPARVGWNLLGDLTGQPLLRTRRLRMWLEELLVRQAERAGTRQSGDSAAVTFALLYETTGIELYVVAVDVAQRQPIVFSAATTPALAVTDAVLASSAIPVAFRPGRLEVDLGGVTRVHRLIDGGVWANYPAFVFKDRSFREHHQLPPVPADSTTIGFTLEHRAGEPAPTPKRLLPGWFKVHGDRGAGLKGLMRLAPVRLYLLTIVPLVIAAQAGWTIHRYGLLFLKDTIRDNESAPEFLVGPAGFLDGFFSDSSFGVFCFYAMLLAVALGAAILMVFGATLLDSALPAMRSLMAVGTNIPYWVGTTAGDHVVRLTVPDTLGTLSFRIAPEKAEQAIAAARAEAAAALAPIMSEAA